MKRIRFTTEIAAPVEKVFQSLIDPEGYKFWTSPFAEGSCFEGTWAKGEHLKFLAPSGCGMLAQVAEFIPNQFISLLMIGSISPDSDQVQPEPQPAYENYTFQSSPTGTTLIVEQDMIEEYEAYMTETWPHALEKLKTLAES